MATSGDVPEVNKLTCAVCLEKYRRPKLLPCFHTFCQSCLQAVAGTSPSFPCPACRTPVLIPPGGVAALQANFYIEQDLDTDSTTPTARLCDVCAEDREATHNCLQCQQRYCVPCRRFHDSITSCRSHTVVSVQSDDQTDGGNLKGNNAMNGEKEEMCPKHRNQPVILHCTVCTSNICMQCKLTSHEGHATEDLADTGAKVKAKIQDMLKTMNVQKRNLEAVLAAFEGKHCKLQSLHDTTEEDIKGRAEKAHRWVDECQDKALQTLQSLNDELVKSVTSSKENVQHKHAALAAQSDHVTRVLREDKDADIVSLEAQLKELAVDSREVHQLLNEAENESDSYTCEHNPAALRPSHLQEYVGQLKMSAPKKSGAQPASGGTTSAVTAPSVRPPTSPSSNTAVRVSELFYSRNPRSKIVAMCTASEKRVWIKYAPSGEGKMMGLFSKDGLLKELDSVLPGKCMVTVLNDALVCMDRSTWSWVQPAGGKGSSKADNIEHTFRLSKCLVQGQLFISVGISQKGNKVIRCSVTSLDPFKFAYKPVISTGRDVLDVTSSQMYLALSRNPVNTMYMYRRSEDTDEWREISSYSFKENSEILDACFLPVDGQEMLVVLVKGDNKLHVLDHTDGCRFVRYLDTGSVKLVDPYRLATDHETLLWIGCHGGRVVLLELGNQT